MKSFSKSWLSSTNAGKQRKYRVNAPLHLKRKLASCHLSKALREKYGKRNVVVRTGDKVKVLRGQFKGHEGKVEKVDLSTSKVIIGGIDIQKKDGNKTQFPINISNIMITEVKAEDKKRKLQKE